MSREPQLAELSFAAWALQIQAAYFAACTISTGVGGRNSLAGAGAGE